MPIGLFPTDNRRKHVEFDSFTPRHAAVPRERANACLGDCKLRVLRIELSRSLQFNDRQVLSTREVADLELEPSTSPTANLHVRPSTRRTSRPTSPRLESRCATGGRLFKVDFIGSPEIQPGMWPMTVVPHDEKRELTSEFLAAVRDDQPSRALVFDRPDESFDDGDTAVLTHGTESLVDILSAAPLSETS